MCISNLNDSGNLMVLQILNNKKYNLKKYKKIIKI